MHMCPCGVPSTCRSIPRSLFFHIEIACRIARLKTTSCVAYGQLPSIPFARELTRPRATPRLNPTHGSAIVNSVNLTRHAPYQWNQTKMGIDCCKDGLAQDLENDGVLVAIARDDHDMVQVVRVSLNGAIEARDGCRQRVQRCMEGSRQRCERRPPPTHARRPVQTR